MFFNSYRQSDGVIVLSRDMRDFLVEQGVPPDQVHVIPNWVDTDLIFPIKENNRFRKRHGLEDKFIVMYSGNLGMSQHLDRVLEAARLLCDEKDLVFAIVGNGIDRERLERIAAEEHLDNVRFLGYQPKSALAETLSAADLHIVVLRPELQRYLMPSKFYGVLASGTPTIAVTTCDSELGQVVLQEDVGVCGEAGGRGVAAMIAQCKNDPAGCENWARNARKLAESKYQRHRCVESFRNLLESAIGPLTSRLTRAGLASQCA
jgi:colanic acid biosynthesis glycosyl transferase WcaI